MVFTKKIIWEPINLGLFLEKFYVRINRNWHNISIKIVYERTH